MSEEALAGKQINRRAFLNQSATIAAGSNTNTAIMSPVIPTAVLCMREQSNEPYDHKRERHVP